MKFYILIVFLITYNILNGQNIGVGISNPSEKLDINGAIRINNTNSNNCGTIKFSNNDFLGYTDTVWKSLVNTDVPKSGIILSDSFPNSNLTNNGYTYLSTIILEEVITPPTAGEGWEKISKHNDSEYLQKSSVVWTGTDMIIWGGYDGYDYHNEGWKYNKATNTWALISTINAPSPRSGATALWTGTEMIIWGGIGTGTNSGAKYNPITDTWSLISTTNCSMGGKGIWTGNEMIVVGGSQNAKYNPTTDNWSPISNTNAPTALSLVLWTGIEVLTWNTNSGSRYNSLTNIWTPISSTGSPSTRFNYSGIWTGTEMIIWGGEGGTYYNTGFRYNPITDSWSQTSTIDAPLARRWHSAVWTGAEMIIWGGMRSLPWCYLNDGARYNPLSDTWTSMNDTEPLPSPRYENKVVWCGTEMIIWGGINSMGQPDGWKYAFNNHYSGGITQKKNYYLYKKN